MFTIPKTITFAIVGGALSAAMPAHATGILDFSALASEMDARCADRRFSGVVSVSVGGQVAFSRLCGEGITLDARFKLFSTSKLLTALAIMSLVEERRMGLDETVFRYLPDLPPNWRSVTLRQLLDHTSGLPDETAALLDAFETDHASAMREVLATLKDAPSPESLPGQDWRYNNFGYELLAEAAARVEGRSFDVVLKERVLIPAGMADAVVELALPAKDGDQPISEPDPRLVDGFIQEEAGQRPAVSYSFVQLGAGGVHATVTDLLALEQALREERIVSHETWTTMVEASRPDAPSISSARYGLGLMMIERAGLKLQGHTGGNNGYVTTYRRVPERDAAIVGLSNFGWSEAKWIEEAAAAALAESAEDGVASLELRGLIESDYPSLRPAGPPPRTPAPETFRTR